MVQYLQNNSFHHLIVSPVREDGLEGDGFKSRHDQVACRRSTLCCGGGGSDDEKKEKK